MQKKESQFFFFRFLLLTVISFLVVLLVITIGTNNKVFAAISLLLLIVMVFLLLSALVTGISQMFKHLFNKEKEAFDYMYVINIVFALVINGLYIMFYLRLVAGTFLTLIA